MDRTAELPAAAAAAGGRRPWPPFVLGRYRLGRRLGSGGFGTVFAARDERLDRPVAVKVIPGGGASGDRARREAMAAARLDHPGIVAVFDAGEDDGARYLISELVAGETLDRLTAAGELSDRDVLRIGLTLADALAHARDRGVIHRDVKPQNVIVPAAGREGGEDEEDSRRGGARVAAKLTDFGVAHLAGDEPLTRTGDVVGTLAYMAPEQAAGERVDDRVDLYALALVLYEAFAGSNPVRAGSPAATARRVGTVLPPLARARRDLPEELCAALDRALRPDPEERGELDDLATALEDALPGVSDEGGTLAPLPLEGRWARGIPRWAQRALNGAGAGALAAAVATAVSAPPFPPALAAAAVALAVALAPRIGWLIAAAAAVVALAGEKPGWAALAALAAVLGPLLARNRPTAWSLPAAAPVLGLAGMAAAYPVLAGRARHATTRAALGAAGAAWALLAEPVLHHSLVLGSMNRGRWESSALDALRDVAWPLATSGAVLLVVLWAAAAVVLPWIVRGRSLVLDLPAAAGWAAGTAAVTQQLAAHATGVSARPPGLVGGAVAAGALAVATAWAGARARDTVRSA